MRILVAVLIGLAFIPAAQAAYPGTHREPRLEPAASYVAGKTVSVYCADSAESWQQLLATYNLPRTVTGFTDSVGGTTAYLDAPVCEPLLAVGYAPKVLGPALLTLAHEATHLKGVLDEGATDCAALRKVRTIGWLFFRVHPWVFKQIYRAALAAHRQSPPAYRGDC